MTKRLHNLRPFLGEHYGPTLPRDRMTDVKNLVFLRNRQETWIQKVSCLPPSPPPPPPPESPYPRSDATAAEGEHRGAFDRREKIARASRGLPAGACHSSSRAADAHDSGPAGRLGGVNGRGPSGRNGCRRARGDRPKADDIFVHRRGARAQDAYVSRVAYAHTRTDTHAHVDHRHHPSLAPPTT